MADFKEAMALLAELEKGKDVHQRLNPSNFGITLKFLKGIGAAHGDINLDHVINSRDIDALTPAKAAELYHKYFWDYLQLGQIQNQAVANKTLDLAVNVGPVPAVRMLQSSLRDLHQSVAVDGLIGPKTLDAVNDVNPTDLLVRFRDHAADYYHMLAKHVPGMLENLAGWINRLAA